jgi:predicted PurR-regulated permease PerM
MSTSTQHEIVHESNVVFLEPEDKYLKIRSLSLLVLTTIAVIGSLYWAEDFFVTMLLGIFTAYFLNPVVAGLEKIKIPRIVASSLTVALFISVISMSLWGLRGQVESVISELPSISKKITTLITTKKGESLSNLQKVQIAASQVEKAAVATDSASQKSITTQVIIKEQKFKLSDFLWKGSLGFAGMVGEFVTVMFLAYFLLISGDTFKRKLVKLTGPTMANKKLTINILQDINQSIQRYMVMLLVTNVIVAVFMWIALSLFGLKNAGAWAVASGLIHFVPYFGPIITASALGLSAFMQFDSLSMAFFVAGVSMAIATIVGVFITTWMTGRIAQMNAVAVFVSLIFFTWLWGVWGILLGMPVIVIIKVIAEHIEHLSPIAEILGE